MTENLREIYLSTYHSSGIEGLITKGFQPINSKLNNHHKKRRSSIKIKNQFNRYLQNIFHRPNICEGGFIKIYNRI